MELSATGKGKGGTMDDFKGKTVLVTGGSRGLGEAFCREFARMGCRVVLNYAHSREAAEKVASEIGAVACASDNYDENAVKEWSLAHVEACAVRQRAILKDAAMAVKPGGQLLYATCSFSPQENEETVSWFLDRHPDFSCVAARRLYPHTSAGEGQFYALLLREGERVAATYSLYKSDTIPAFEAFRPRLLPLSGSVAGLKDGRVLLLPPMPFPIEGLRVTRAGLLLGEVMGSRFEPAHALAMAGRETPLVQTTALTFEEAMRYLRGETIAKPAEKGFGAATFKGHALGLYKASDGVLKNHYPKGLRLMNGRENR